MPRLQLLFRKGIGIYSLAERVWIHLPHKKIKTWIVELCWIVELRDVMIPLVKAYQCFFLLSCQKTPRQMHKDIFWTLSGHDVGAHSTSNDCGFTCSFVYPCCNGNFKVCSQTLYSPVQSNELGIYILFWMSRKIQLGIVNVAFVCGNQFHNEDMGRKYVHFQQNMRRSNDHKVEVPKFPN